jgi:hypothetical protein
MKQKDDNVNKPAAGAAKELKPKTTYVVIEHELRGVTPEMFDWWANNINNSERYKLWHPKDHISFEWEVPPSQTKDGHIGATSNFVEKIGGVLIRGRIRYIDPTSSPIKTTYPYVHAGCSLGANDEPRGYSCHEFKAEPWGIRVRSIFQVPADAPREAMDALRQHCKEEMGRLPEFLPELYKRETDG